MANTVVDGIEIPGEFILWAGDVCPVDPGDLVEVVLRSGEREVSEAGDLHWDGVGEHQDVIAYRRRGMPLFMVPMSAGWLYRTSAGRQEFSREHPLELGVAAECIRPAMAEALAAQMQSDRAGWREALSQVRMERDRAVADLANLRKAHREAEAKAAAQSIGWLYLNPGVGTEFSEQHPVESGEVPRAEDVREATPDRLLTELRRAWRLRAEVSRMHQHALISSNASLAEIKALKADKSALEAALKAANERRGGPTFNVSGDLHLSIGGA